MHLGGTFSFSRRERAASGALHVIGVGAALGTAHQGGYVVQAANAATGAERGTVEGCHGIGKVEGLAHRHGLKTA